MSGGVFICYRREDSAGFAGRIYDRLRNSLGHDGVFIDVDNIPAGHDFVDVLSERVGRCDALIAVIGRKWLASADKGDRRRLDDPDDFVRIEIQAALERNVPVIPVLVDGAAMPQADELPRAIKRLARRQGIEISHNRFDSDAERLTDALARIAERTRQDQMDAGRASRGDEKLPTSAIPGQSVAANKGAPRDVAASAPALARTKFASLALAAIAILIVLAFGARLLMRGRTAPPEITPAEAGDADTPAPSQQWMDLEDFKAEYQRQAARNYYPDKVWGRCWNGVGQRSVAHWSPYPTDHYISLNHTVVAAASRNGERDFKSDAADMTANGFKMKSDSAFQGCDGFMRHLTLWTKGQ